MSAHIAGEVTSTMTIEEFCLRNRISGGTFHKLQREGRAPALIRFSPQLVRVTIEAEREWRMRLSAPDPEGAERQAAMREVAQGRRRKGGGAAVLSPLHISEQRRRRKAEEKAAAMGHGPDDDDPYPTAA